MTGVCRSWDNDSYCANIKPKMLKYQKRVKDAIRKNSNGVFFVKIYRKGEGIQ